MSTEINTIAAQTETRREDTSGNLNSMTAFVRGLDLNSQIALGGAAVVLLASVFTWVSIATSIGTFSFIGLRTTTGVLSLLVALAYAGWRTAPHLIPAMQSWAGRGKMAAFIIPAVSTLFVTLFILMNLSYVSFGAYISLLGHAALVYGAVQQWWSAR